MRAIRAERVSDRAVRELGRSLALRDDRRRVLAGRERERQPSVAEHLGPDPGGPFGEDALQRVARDLDRRHPARRAELREHPERARVVDVQVRAGDPAFGSGEHETTASCLEELERLPGLKGMRCLDLGSGTGILAIAAARLGAQTVVAVDIDPAAGISCAGNVRLNGQEERVFPVCGELACIGEGTFDLLLANIYADIHLALAVGMVARTRSGGFLLLSGIPVHVILHSEAALLGAACHGLTA